MYWYKTHFPDSKVHGANMGPIWGRQDPGGPHVGPHEPCYLGLIADKIVYRSHVGGAWPVGAAPTISSFST